MTETTTADRGAHGLARRELLIGAGAVLAGLSVTPPGRTLIGGLPFVGASNVDFERPDIAVRLGESFRIVRGASAGTVLTLTDIVELPHAAGMTDLRFAVRFASGGAAALAQDTYVLASRSFGELPLFISPIVGPDGQPSGYEALVDRYIPVGAQP